MPHPLGPEKQLSRNKAGEQAPEKLILKVHPAAPGPESVRREGPGG